jgi:prepilin-type N-terminal cleavage/methylation domain-containing protein
VNHKRAFTLIELLVVIAIISLLVSILLPSLTRAQNLAKRAVRFHNIRAQCMSQMIAVNDMEGVFPPHHDYTPCYVRSGANVTGRSLVYETMRDYVENRSIFICPWLAAWGSEFATTDWSISGYGGWGSGLSGSPPPNVLIPYFWFANYRTVGSGRKPLFEFNSREGYAVNEPEWPTRADECSANKAFISHRMYFHEGFNVFYDHTHGGSLNGYWDSSPLLAETTAEENPVGYADGHAEATPRSALRVRARVQDGVYLPFEVYY